MVFSTTCSGITGILCARKTCKTFTSHRDTHKNSKWVCMPACKFIKFLNSGIVAHQVVLTRKRRFLFLRRLCLSRN